jgi:hypothetical protein
MATRLHALFSSAPILCQSVVAGILYAGGDCVAQRLEKAYFSEQASQLRYDHKRTIRMGAFGFIFAGPILAIWYRKLHIMTHVFRYRYEPFRTTGSGYLVQALARVAFRREKLDDVKDSAREVAIKVFFDNLLFQAAFLNFYLLVMGLLQGRSLSDAYERCKHDFHDAWAYSCVYWIPAQTLNFALVPAPYHGLCVSMFNALWKVFLSVLYHRRDFGGGGHLQRTSVAAEEVCDESEVVRSLRCEIAHQRALLEVQREQINELMNLRHP